MLIRQACSITGMDSSIFLHLFLCEAVLTLARITLDTCQKLYNHQLISFPDEYPANKILPISLRIRRQHISAREITGKQSYVNPKYSTNTVRIVASLANDRQSSYRPRRWS